MYCNNVEEKQTKVLKSTKVKIFPESFNGCLESRLSKAQPWTVLIILLFACVFVRDEFRMLKGGMTESGQQMQADCNARLEQGIEQLREKYAQQEEIAAKQAKVDERIAEVNEALCARACAEKERLNPTVDMTMEDTDLEALRQERMNALKSRASAAKRHVEQGGGEYHEIEEDSFLKEVRERGADDRALSLRAKRPVARRSN